MGRKPHARSLSVWSNGERVGTWTIPARGDMQFLYDRAWRASPLGRPLSLSLPYTDEAPVDVKRIDATPSENEVERHLIRITRPGPPRSRDDNDELRISLAGAQE